MKKILFFPIVVLLPMLSFGQQVKPFGKEEYKIPLCQVFKNKSSKRGVEVRHLISYFDIVDSLYVLNMPERNESKALGDSTRIVMKVFLKKNVRLFRLNKVFNHFKIAHKDRRLPLYVNSKLLNDPQNSLFYLPDLELVMVRYGKLIICLK